MMIWYFFSIDMNMNSAQKLTQCFKRRLHNIEYGVLQEIFVDEFGILKIDNEIDHLQSLIYTLKYANAGIDLWLTITNCGNVGIRHAQHF